MPHIRSLNIMKEVGRIWSTITNKELARYKILAEADLVRYKKEHEKFMNKINELRNESFLRISGMAQQDIPKD